MTLTEVQYRNKHGLLHTLPKKKLEIFKLLYPDILSKIYNSKNKYNSKIKNICTKPKIPDRVHFGNVKVKII